MVSGQVVEIASFVHLKSSQTMNFSLSHIHLQHSRNPKDYSISDQLTNQLITTAHPSKVISTMHPRFGISISHCVGIAYQDSDL